MDWLLRIKHWQLFLLLAGIPMLFQIFFIVIFVRQDNPELYFSFFPVIMIVCMGIFFGWFYALGTNLYKKLPPEVKMNLKLFKIFLTVPVCYILVICVFMSVTFSKFMEVAPGDSPHMAVYASVFIPVHLFAMFCIFYCLYFIAKTMKAVEWQRPVTFSDYAGEFFLLWFYIIGIWILQPRINKLFDKKNDDLSNESFSFDKN